MAVSLRSSLAEAQGRARVEKDTNWLTLRKRFGSQLAQAGVSIFKIQKWLGHSDPRMTMEHYAHLSPEYDEDINRFPVGVEGGVSSGRWVEKSRKASW